MKKFIALMMSVLMLVGVLAGCSVAKPDETESDLDYIKNKGKLVVGITEFAPMDYQDAEGNWIGFDADMAAAFAESIGVEVEFVVIAWETKVIELTEKTIDCVWNGMTLGEEVLAAMSCSNAYCDNAQVVIVRADEADKYNTVEACANLNFAVEAGSAGETQCIEHGFNYIPLTTQADALTEVKAGTSDAGVLDALMAAAMTGEGTGFADLTYTVALNSEQYGVGFRQGSDLTETLNEFFKTAYADGTMMKIAETYGIQASIIPQN